MLVDLEEATEEARYGGKAVELGAAVRAGLPVPGGFAVSWEFVEQVREDEAARSRLVERVRGLAGPFVVRSSGIGEDSEEASFAGQHETVINIRTPSGVLEGLEQVYASCHSEAAMKYRDELGIDAEPKMGAVVQSLVDADQAGVLFSRNPVNGSEERVIEASWGLGEAVVESLVTPDNVRMRPGGEVVERRIGTKEIYVTPAPDGGTETKPVPAAKQDRFCLTEAELHALEELAQQCEAYRGGGHDIEWAFDSDELFLLQRRDITTT